MRFFIYCAVVALLILYFHRRLKNPGKPRVKVKAEVVKLDVARSYGTQMTGIMGGIGGSSTYWAVFKLKDGRKKELLIGGGSFAQLDVGDKGVLTYQGDRFKGFQKHAS